MTTLRLDDLVGRWEIETPFGVGRAEFHWLEVGGLLVQRSDADRPADAAGDPGDSWPFPVTSVFGTDDATGEVTMLYSDARDVHRVYRMTIADRVWKIWRDAPGFSQRFTGVFSDDGNTVTAKWEFSEDGVDWKHDFDLTYRRI